MEFFKENSARNRNNLLSSSKSYRQTFSYSCCSQCDWQKPLSYQNSMSQSY